MDKEKLVCSWMSDEESRFVFEKRLLYNKTKDFGYMQEIVDKYLPHLAKRNVETLKKLLKDGTENVFFGAGEELRKICVAWKNEVLPFRIATDNNQALWGTVENGINIIDPDSINWSNVDNVVITPRRKGIPEVIYKQLQSYGVPEEKIIVYTDWVQTVDEEMQYFDSAIIKWNERELFVDAGAFDLATSIRFAKQCKKAGTKGSFLAFEPDAVLYKRCKDNLDKYHGEIYNAGLWSSNTTLFFNATHNAGARIVNEETEESIDVVALDNFVDKEVTFIKMDIEGAEMEALKGASEIIRKYKPKMAICVYHKTCDIITIPIYIKELVPEYKLYMRHYSRDTAETVLYAVID